MPGESHTTTARNIIRHWIEARGGHPATVRGTERGGEHADILRVDFPDGGADQKLKSLEWDELFQKFWRNRSRLPLSERNEGRQDQPFFKLVTQH